MATRHPAHAPPASLDPVELAHESSTALTVWYDMYAEFSQTTTDPNARERYAANAVLCEAELADRQLAIDEAARTQTRLAFDADAPVVAEGV